ncbi:LysE family transporter [Pseudalkalibacillus berkeleyi]|uniref:LysE family translocator n=1 Tax=Pseudalkalibacillus berkeleyi TaxID=1069813 RepID=A0ABS9GUC6_9BACL|nr:LysE family transporter [Pseudalkalibacillus berkeleyi]MCF6136442.1 LysE family translocator [Pseudalkalibacillus berkeleyi]
MGIFFGYIVLGLSLSAPIGPINAAQLDKGIKFGFLNAWIVGIGAMVADLLFMLLIYFGVAQFLDMPFVKTFLWLFGFFVLVYTGVESIVHSKQSMSSGKSIQESATKSFRTGFYMALSNPLNILFWLGIYGSVLAKTAHSNGSFQLFIYSSGIFIGILIWDLIMASVASGLRGYLKPQILSGISIVAGLFLIAFGCYFGYQAYQMFI